MFKCKKAPCILLLLLFAVLFIGCSPAKSSISQDDNKLAIAVSIIPEKTFVEAVAGDLVNTIVMIPPGYSPANYAPSPQELMNLSQSSLYFSIGVPTEKANILPKLLENNKAIKVIDLAAAVAKEYPEREFSAGKRDPHIWLSPRRAKIMVNTIAASLSELDPQNKEVYLKNALKYTDELNELDQKIKTALQNCQNKTFLIYHPSLGYFADDYGLKMIAVEKSGKEASVNELMYLINQAKNENIKVIFHQEEIDSRQSETLAKEIGGKTQLFAPLSADYLLNMERMAATFSQILND